MQNLGITSKTSKEFVNGAHIREPHKISERCPQIFLNTGAGGSNDFMDAFFGRSGTELDDDLPGDMLACWRFDSLRRFCAR